MSKIQSIQNVVTPTAKSVMGDVSKMSKVTAPASKDITASAADAMSNQNKAMINMNKKPYEKPRMETIEIESEQSVLTASNPEYDPISGQPGGDDYDPFY